jgi:serine/threonine protein kinase
MMDDEFWNATSASAFKVCLADFGESKIYMDDEESYTLRNRGTEFMKSPEMLTVAYASKKNRDTYDRRKKVIPLFVVLPSSIALCETASYCAQIGASSASDVWSLGCLFYELLTGEFLFFDADWVRFYLRVTSAGQALIPPEKRAKLGSQVCVLNPWFRCLLIPHPRCLSISWNLSALAIRPAARRWRTSSCASR